MFSDKIKSETKLVSEASLPPGLSPQAVFDTPLSPRGSAPKTPKEPLNQEIKNLYFSFLLSNFSSYEIQIILSESNKFFPIDENELKEKIPLSYSELQNKLSTINELSQYRKKNGVYYTENDITNFIVSNCLKLSSGINAKSLKESNYSNICKKSVFDPTCGSGAFLLTALELKLAASKSEKSSIKQIINSLFGNDLDETSILITKLRLFICILNFSGINELDGIAECLNLNFTNADIFSLELNKRFDLVVGNPPYVEESKSDSKFESHYGNIYANVLAKATKYLSDSGVFGFIVPLSYCSTPRMRGIRAYLSEKLNTQILFSYADRPGCLFTGVHQKLNIILGTVQGNGELYTTGYQYWYREERNKLFKSQKYILNQFQNEKFIPKIGNSIEKAIYKKICSQSKKLNLADNGFENLYLNMRGCFWIKVFLAPHTTNEYKTISFHSQSERNFIYCLLASSLFWWFWICISDGWHITSKEINEFRIPESYDSEKVSQLAFQLDNKLEETKKFIGTIQTQYEYKHKLCISEIHQIDDYINTLYGLTDSESEYIKNFALPYRTSVGVAK